MFCFRCKIEYQPGIGRCSACGSLLVYRFPSPQWISESDRTLVFLQRFQTELAGEVAKMTLKAAGIESLLVRGRDRNNVPAISFQVGAEIFVRSEDVEDAKAILNGDILEPL